MEESTNDETFKSYIEGGAIVKCTLHVHYPEGDPHEITKEWSIESYTGAALDEVLMQAIGDSPDCRLFPHDVKRTNGEWTFICIEVANIDMYEKYIKEGIEEVINAYQY